MPTPLDAPPRARRPPVRRDSVERVAAWLYTGPLGHLYGAAADIAVLWVAWVASAARARIRGLRAGGG